MLDTQYHALPEYVSYTLLQLLGPFQRKPKVRSSSPNKKVPACAAMEPFECRYGPDWFNLPCVAGLSSRACEENRGTVEHEVFWCSMLRADSRAYVRRDCGDLEGHTTADQTMPTRGVLLNPLLFFSHATSTQTSCFGGQQPYPNVETHVLLPLTCRWLITS